MTEEKFNREYRIFKIIRGTGEQQAAGFSNTNQIELDEYHPCRIPLKNVKHWSSTKLEFNGEKIPATAVSCVSKGEYYIYTIATPFEIFDDVMRLYKTS